MSPMTRREFIAASATSLVAASIPQVLAQTANHASPAKPWYSTMRRCGQLNYNEVDPLTIDPEAWMDYWASLKVDAVLINGGGIVALYPTEVPYHHRSRIRSARVICWAKWLTAAKQAGQFERSRPHGSQHVFRRLCRLTRSGLSAIRDGSARPHPYSAPGFTTRACSARTSPSRCPPSTAKSISITIPTASLPMHGLTSGRWTSASATPARKIYRDKVGGLPSADDRRFATSAYRKLLRDLHGSHCRNLEALGRYRARK